MKCGLDMKLITHKHLKGSLTGLYNCSHAKLSVGRSRNIVLISQNAMDSVTRKMKILFNQPPPKMEQLRLCALPQGRSGLHVNSKNVCYSGSHKMKGAALMLFTVATRTCPVFHNTPDVL